MDGHDRAPRAAERERVLEVDERGAQAPQRARHAPGHPRLLEARGSSTGSMPGGTSSGRRVKAASRSPAPPRLRQRAEQLAHVGLVAGAAAAEDVGIEDDERPHAAASR